MLYRPFLHYISPRLSAGKVVDESYYACAAAGISVCRNIIHIAMEIKNQALVVGPFWSMLYTQFFAILTLVFYTLENPDKPGSAEIFAEASAGREMIAKMALRSLAADRITTSLNSLWENLPESVKEGKPRSVSTKKRPAAGPKPGPVPLSTHKTPLPPSRGRDTRTGVPLAFRSPMQGGRSSSRGFSVNPSELHGLDVSGTGASDAGTPSSSHTADTPYIPQHSNTPNQALNQSPNDIYKFDAMMFSSGDPFAYPNQPLVETQPTQMPPPPQADSSGFYMGPGLYGGIEGQLSEFVYNLYTYISTALVRGSEADASLPQLALCPRTLCSTRPDRLALTYRHKCTSHPARWLRNSTTSDRAATINSNGTNNSNNSSSNNNNKLIPEWAVKLTT